MEESTYFIPSDSTNRCASTLELSGDEASKIKKYDEALAAYSAALFLGPLIPNTILIKWMRTMLVHGSVNEAGDAAVKVCLSRSTL